MPDVYVGLGSNHEPDLHLPRAVARLAERFGAVACSSVYRSPAVGDPAPDYYNLVARFATRLEGAELRQAFAATEAAAGRIHAPGALVTLDVDLLLYGARVDPALHVPREDVLRRAFVRVPLAELAPGLRHPVTGEPIGGAEPALVRVGTVDAPQRWK